MGCNHSNPTVACGEGIGGICYTSYANGKVIKAELHDTCFDVANVQDKIFKGANVKSFFPMTAICTPNGEIHVKDSMLLNDVYMAKAKCNLDDGDKISPEVGMELARGRCLERYHRAFDKRMLEFVKDLRTLLACAERYCAKANIDTSSLESVEEIKVSKFTMPNKPQK